MLANALETAANRLGEFRALIRGISYERKGILNSEMYFLWLCAQSVKPKRILESGRARGQSTLTLSRCFPETEIISVEHDPNSPDVAVAADRLKSEPNVRLLFGDATRMLPELARPDDIALIDGPKGFRGVRLALALLASGKFPQVFVHDTGPKTAERFFIERHYPDARYSDEPGMVDVSHVLDDEEAMAIPESRRYMAVKGNIGYGYGLACMPYDKTISFFRTRLLARLTDLGGRLIR